MSTEKFVAELGPILDGLMQATSGIREEAEAYLRRITVSQPGEVLLALAQVGALAVGGYQSDHRLLALILLRRLAFRTLPGLVLNEQERNACSPFDYIGERTRSKIETVLCAGIRDELDTRMRKGLGSCAAAWATECAQKHRPCLPLPPVLLELAMSDQPMQRYTTYQILKACPAMLVDSVTEPTPAGQIAQLLLAGLHDTSFDVRVEAVGAVQSILSDGLSESDKETLGILLVAESFSSVAQFPLELMSHGLLPLVEVAEQYPHLLMANQASIFPFLLQFLAPPSSCVPEYADHQFSWYPSFVDSYEEWTDICRPAVEILLAMLEAWPADTMAWQHGRVLRELVGWVMADFVAGQMDDMDNAEWLETPPLEHEPDPPAGEVLRRMVAVALCAYAAILFRKPDWRCREAGLNGIYYAIEALHEATQETSSKTVGYPTHADFLSPLIDLSQDENPRIRWGWLTTIGEMCRYFDAIMQHKHSEDILPRVVALMHDPIPKVRAQTMICLEGYFSQELKPQAWTKYQFKIAENMVQRFHEGPLFVSEAIMRSIPSFGMDLAKHSSEIALNVLDPIEEFAEPAVVLVGEMLKIQESITAADDPRALYVMKAGADFCRALGDRFVPFLPHVLPPLLKTASYQPKPAAGQSHGITVEDAGEEDDDGTLAANTSELEDKTLALATLADYATALGPNFAPYVAEVMPIALDSLRIRESYEVREAAPLLIVSSLKCAKDASRFDSISLEAIFDALLKAARKTEWYTETAMDMKCFEDCLHVINIPLPKHIIDKLIATVNALLDDLYDTRDMRASQSDWMNEQEYHAELDLQIQENEALVRISSCVQRVIDGCRLGADPMSIEMVQMAGVLERIRRIDAMRLQSARQR